MVESKGCKDGEIMPSRTLKNLCRMEVVGFFLNGHLSTCAVLFLSTWLCTLLSSWRMLAHWKEVCKANWDYPATNAPEHTGHKRVNPPQHSLGEQLHRDDSPVSQFFKLGMKRSTQVCQLLKDSCGLTSKWIFSIITIAEVEDSGLILKLGLRRPGATDSSKGPGTKQCSWLLQSQQGGGGGQLQVAFDTQEARARRSGDSASLATSHPATSHPLEEKWGCCCSSTSRIFI